jgi:hypothetical protein
MKKIIYNGKLIALIIDTAADFRQGVHFLSEEDWPLQLGLLAHPEGHSIPAHRHVERITSGKITTQEFLLLLSGRMDVDFYDGQGVLIQSETLVSGQALLQVSGGHGFSFRGPSRIIELKLGPYLGKDKDKEAIVPLVAKQ